MSFNILSVALMARIGYAINLSVIRFSLEPGESLNTTIKQLLRRSLQIESKQSPSSPTGYRQFLGKWDQSEADEFEKAVQDFNTVDETDWE